MPLFCADRSPEIITVSRNSAPPALRSRATSPAQPGRGRVWRMASAFLALVAVTLLSWRADPEESFSLI